MTVPSQAERLQRRMDGLETEIADAKQRQSPREQIVAMIRRWNAAYDEWVALRLPSTCTTSDP